MRFRAYLTAIDRYGLSLTTNTLLMTRVVGLSFVVFYYGETDLEPSFFLQK